MEVQDKQGF
jgi:hypothetical protein